MYIKRFLHLKQKSDQYSNGSVSNRKNEISSIEEYIKAYYYVNFKELYPQFDRNIEILIGHGSSKSVMSTLKGDRFFEQLKLKDLSKIFVEMRAPFKE